MRRLAFASILTLLLAPFTWASGQELALPPQSSATSFAPQLLVNEEPDVCSLFLKAMQIGFDAPRQSIDVNDTPDWAQGQDFEWIFRDSRKFGSQTEYNEPHNAPRMRANGRSIDIEGNGNQQYFVQLEVPLGRGNQYSLLLFESRASFMSALEATPDAPNHLARLGQVLTNESWAPQLALRIGTKFYLVERPSYPWFTQSSTTLLRLHGNGSLQTACTVRLVPEQLATLERASVPEFSKYYEVLARITGTYRSPSQSANRDSCSGPPPATVFSAASNALIRPWTLRGSPSESSEDTARARREIETRLSEWSRVSLYNFRAWRRLPAIEQSALEQLTAHYRNYFGVSDDAAHILAKQTIDRIFINHFSFERGRPLNDLPNPSEMANSALSFDPGPDLATRYLKSAALAGASDQVIEHLLDHGADPIGLDHEGDWHGKTEPSIFFALEHPRIVSKFLDGGADIEIANEFGKTALMYAAHFDLRETAELLVDRGADPNRRTSRPQPSYNYPYIGTRDRTALMYAAENASLQLIQLLVARGADIRSVDSNRHRAMDYLEFNCSLTDADRAQAEALLKPKDP
jgi:hypothetical protein